MPVEAVGMDTETLSRSEVHACLEAVLGRTVDDALIDYHVGLGFPNPIEFGKYLKGTEEFKNSMPIPADAGRKPALFLGDRVLAYTHSGDRIFLFPQDQDLTMSILETGRWEPYVEKAITRLVGLGDRVIEAGANIGYHTLALARQVGPSGIVHAFEANPQVARLLLATLFQNTYSSHVGVGRVTLHQKALADREGQLVLQAAPDHYGSGHLISGHTGSDFGADYSTHFQVEAVSADNYFADLASVDFIHLDIEGAEPLAIAGASALIARSPRVKILIEWAVGMMQATGSLDRMIETLVGQGFRFWHVNKDSSGFTPVGTGDLLNLPHCDVVISRQDPA